jgi:hypothetical protein
MGCVGVASTKVLVLILSWSAWEVWRIKCLVG